MATTMRNPSAGVSSSRPIERLWNDGAIDVLARSIRGVHNVCRSFFLQLRVVLEAAYTFLLARHIPGMLC